MTKRISSPLLILLAMTAVVWASGAAESSQPNCVHHLSQSDSGHSSKRKANNQNIQASRYEREEQRLNRPNRKANCVMLSTGASHQCLGCCVQTTAAAYVSRHTKDITLVAPWHSQSSAGIAAIEFSDSCFHPRSWSTTSNSYELPIYRNALSISQHLRI